LQVREEKRVLHEIKFVDIKDLSDVIMSVSIINPKNNTALRSVGDRLVDMEGNYFPIIKGVPRIAHGVNYTDNFGVQWNKFRLTQLDREEDGLDLSFRRFFSQTHWDEEDLSEKAVLEVGCGAGRFSKVVLQHTNATLYSVDYSDAVTANMESNGHIAPDRFHLFQASVYEMPFPDNSFDKIFCFGVLQHTPDFDASIKALIDKAKRGGEIAVDFYSVRGWWTKVNAKYLLRPITKRMSHDRLLSLIEKNVDWLIDAHFFLHRIGLGVLTRFLPVCNVKDSFPATLTKPELREWTVLDTFDQYSPQHDHPQRIAAVAQMFKRHGARVTFSGYEEVGKGRFAAVVRGIKQA
jgi:SAM-dependent methyltransferase